MNLSVSFRKIFQGFYFILFCFYFCFKRHQVIVIILFVRCNFFMTSFEHSIYSIQVLLWKTRWTVRMKNFSSRVSLTRRVYVDKFSLCNSSLFHFFILMYLLIWFFFFLVFFSRCYVSMVSIRGFNGVEFRRRFKEFDLVLSFWFKRLLWFKELVLEFLLCKLNIQ